jgi:hypothetical protein
MVIIPIRARIIVIPSRMTSEDRLIIEEDRILPELLGAKKIIPVIFL